MSNIKVANAYREQFEEAERTLEPINRVKQQLKGALMAMVFCSSTDDRKDRIEALPVIDLFKIIYDMALVECNREKDDKQKTDLMATGGMVSLFHENAHNTYFQNRAEFLMFLDEFRQHGARFDIQLCLAERMLDIAKRERDAYQALLKKYEQSVGINNSSAKEPQL